MADVLVSKYQTQAGDVAQLAEGFLRMHEALDHPLALHTLDVERHVPVISALMGGGKRIRHSNST